VGSFHKYLWSVETWQIIFLGTSLSLMPQGKKWIYLQRIAFYVSEIRIR
jgi:hypothetical protein